MPKGVYRRQPAKPISELEKAILYLLLTGVPPGRMADRLMLSDRRVKTALQRIRRRTGQRNILGAIGYLLACGEIAPERLKMVMERGVGSVPDPKKAVSYPLSKSGLCMLLRQDDFATMQRMAAIGGSQHEVERAIGKPNQYVSYWKRRLGVEFQPDRVPLMERLCRARP